MKRLIVTAVMMFTLASAQAGIKTQEVEYSDGTTNMKGYLAFDDSIKGKRPGVLVVHEWWGLNDYARKRARMLAGLGYTALAIDMYGGGKKADHPDTARKFYQEARKNMATAEARFKAALKVLQQHASTNAEKIAAIGYCFGGGIVLEMARRGVDLDAVASFHGSLGTATPAKPGKIKTRVLVLTGADDPFAKPEVVAAFKAEMDKANVDYKVISYPGAKHSFTNPDADKFGKKFDMPLAYNAEADKQSWTEMQKMFKEVFGQ